MPTAGKIFRYREELDLEEIHKKLEGYKVSISSEEGVELIADIPNLRLSENELEGWKLLFTERALVGLYGS